MLYLGIDASTLNALMGYFLILPNTYIHYLDNSSFPTVTNLRSTTYSKTDNHLPKLPFNKSKVCSSYVPPKTKYFRLTFPRGGILMSGCVITNSPIWGSRVNPLTPLPMVKTRIVDDEYMQYPERGSGVFRGEV